MILGLDLGSKTGWALAEGDFIQAAGTIQLAKPSVLASINKRNYDPRPWELHIFIRKILAGNPVEAIFFEDVQFKGRGIAQIQLWSTLRGAMWISTHNYPVYAVPVQTLKKFAVKGGASKEQMAMALKNRGYYQDAMDDNAVDAVHLAFYGQKYLRGLD